MTEQTEQKPLTSRTLLFVCMGSVVFLVTITIIAAALVAASHGSGPKAEYVVAWLRKQPDAHQTLCEAHPDSDRRRVLVHDMVTVAEAHTPDWTQQIEDLGDALHSFCG